jgi:hypothetical protein
MEIIEIIHIWLIDLGEEFGVNPYLFGAIYVGAIPFFALAVSKIVQNYRKKKSIVLPVMAASFCFVSAYLYLIIAGQNVPWWVYAIAVGLLVYGGYSTFRKVRNQVKNAEIEADL